MRLITDCIRYEDGKLVIGYRKYFIPNHNVDIKIWYRPTSLYTRYRDKK
jgi:hypothetical protein